MIRSASRLAIGAAIVLASCGQKAPDAGAKPAGPPPATLSGKVREEDLLTVTLTPEAEARLGVVTDRVKRAKVERSAVYAAEVVVKDGRSASVFAPFTGVIGKPERGEAPAAGAQVKRGDVLFRIDPIIAPERSVLTAAERETVTQARTVLFLAKADATSAAEQAAIDVKAARVALDRAIRLAADEAGSARAVDDAKAVLDRAEAALRAAKLRQDALEKNAPASSPTEAPGREITAPQNGMVRDLRVTPGQVVPASAVLCNVVGLDVVWIRVPVPVGEAALLSTDQPARIGPLGRQSPSDQRTASPVDAPPSADPVANTVDRWFETANAAFELRPGERVSAAIPSKAMKEALVIPASAILYDVHGATWVYKSAGPHAFSHRRVVVREISGGSAVIDRGLDEGDLVVVTAAAELFGTQFGAGK